MGINRTKFHYDYYYPEMNIDLGSYVIWQVGELQCEPGYTVEEHVQTVYEISYIVSGQGTFILNDTAYPVCRGDIFIDRIGDRHTVISSSFDPLRYQYVGFDFKEPVRTEEIRRIRDFWNNFNVPISSNAVNIQEAFIDFLNEIEKNDFLSRTLMECSMQRIMCEVYRLFHRDQPEKTLYAADRSGDEKLVYDIVQYLEAHINQSQSLSDLCEVFGYSYSHIAKSFKDVIGETLSEYCQRRRFERAQGNLRRGMSVSEAAELSGYKSIHAFSRAYKQRFGTSPTKYTGPGSPPPRTSAGKSSPAGAAKTLNVAVIGCGDIAHRVHIPQYLRHPQANLLYLCDIDPNRNLEALKRYQCGAMVTDFRVIQHDPQIDAVSVCVPNDMHATIATEFLRSGKAVLCEMPAARSLDGVLRMQESMNRHGQLLMIGMDNRYDSDVNLIRRMILGGQLGDIYHVCIRFRLHRAIPDLGGMRTTQALSGGGVMIDKGVRFLDTALHCLGNPAPQTVSASTFSYLGRNIREYVYEEMEHGPPKPDGVYDVEDSLTAFIRTDSAVISLQGAWAQNIGEEEVYIDFMGDQAGVRYTPDQGFTVFGSENGALISYSPSHPKRDRYEAEIDHFLSCVAQKRFLEEDMKHTVTTMRIVQAIYDSAASHAEVDMR